MADLFSWLHLSDVHFGHYDAGHVWDQKLVLDRLRQDIEEQLPVRGAPDAIFVTGDIAFGGRVEQYRDAMLWLKELAELAKVAPENLFVVPGNHDVLRSTDTSDRSVGRLVRALRSATEDIDTVLATSADEALLQTRKANYIAFSSAFPGVGAPHPFFWTASREGRESLRVRIVGLDTAMLAADDQDRGKLRLGKQPFARTLVGVQANELVIVLTHHPFRGGWLLDEQDAANEIKSRAHIHLSGHVHDAESEEARSGSGASIVKVSAGAVHGDKLPRGVPASHGYSFGAVVSKGKKTRAVRIWPRRWHDKNREFEPERTKAGLDYAEHVLALKLAGAAVKASAAGSVPARPPAVASRRVLLAWSGQRGHSLASLLETYVSRVLPYCVPSLTDGRTDAPEGGLGAGHARGCFGLLCVTPEDADAPWFMYQAGTIGRDLGESKIVALLLGPSFPDVIGPLRRFTRIEVSRDGIFELLKKINAHLGAFAMSDEALRQKFDESWLELESGLAELARIAIPGSHLAPVVKAFAQRGFAQPVGGEQAFFLSGFESHGLYSTITETAKERLLLFGRKNRKIFDKEHQRFFDQLAARVRNGFRFQVLFLDPDAPDHVIDCAHSDREMRKKLQEYVAHAADVLQKAGLNPAEHCRLYRFQRTMSIAVADQAVLYSPVSVDSNGCARPLTRAPFELLSAQSDYGREMLQAFEGYWAASKPWSPPSA